MGAFRQVSPSQNDTYDTHPIKMCPQLMHDIVYSSKQYREYLHTGDQSS